jgi:hypothetical protein
VIREEDIKRLRAYEHTGRPLGGEGFLATLEQTLGRILKRQKPGPKTRRGELSSGPFFLSLPIAFIAYGAFLGGRAARFILERDGAGGRPRSSGLEGVTTIGEES